MAARTVAEQILDIVQMLRQDVEQMKEMIGEERYNRIQFNLERVRRFAYLRTYSVYFRGCLLWTGFKGCGWKYGIVSIDGKHFMAHRLSWSIFYGDIPKGKELLHSCDTPACINTEHLRLGTRSENLMEAGSKNRMCRIGRALQTHCSNGHELTPENTNFTNVLYDGKRGKEYRRWRVCRKCKSNQDKLYRLRLKEKTNA